MKLPTKEEQIWRFSIKKVYFFIWLSVIENEHFLNKFNYPLFLYVHFLYLHKENEPKESAAGHLVPLTEGLPCAARQERATSESRFTPPSRLSVLSCAARLREMAEKLILSRKPVLCRWASQLVPD
jgi:hypothetical protein